MLVRNELFPIKNVLRVKQGLPFLLGATMCWAPSEAQLPSCDLHRPGKKGHGTSVRIRCLVATAISGGHAPLSCTRCKGRVKTVTFCLFFKPNLCFVGLSSGYTWDLGSSLNRYCRTTAQRGTWLNLQEKALLGRRGRGASCLRREFKVKLFSQTGESWPSVFWKLFCRRSKFS